MALDQPRSSLLMLLRPYQGQWRSHSVGNPMKCMGQLSSSLQSHSMCTCNIESRLDNCEIHRRPYQTSWRIHRANEYRLSRAEGKIVLSKVPDIGLGRCSAESFRDAVPGKVMRGHPNTRESMARSDFPCINHLIFVLMNANNYRHSDLMGFHVMIHSIALDSLSEFHASPAKSHLCFCITIQSS